MTNKQEIDRYLIVENKLTKARTQLILDKPFLGNLVLRLPLVVADVWCKTTATDAKNFYYNADFIDILSPEQTKFVLVHEALHCALTHFARRGHRKKHRWDLACDFAINPLLIKEGFHPPIDIPIFKEYGGMVAEEIYPMIDDKLDNEPMDEHLYDDDSSSDLDNGVKENDLDNKDKQQNKDNSQDLAQKPPPLSPDEMQSLASKWQKNLASSAQIAKQAGKLEGELAKLVDFFLQPQLSWRALLAQYVSAQAKNDFSYYRTTRREGDFILPALKSEYINIAIAVDTSGSISQLEIDEFITEISTIKALMRSSISLFACDDKLNNNSPWFYDAWQELEFPAQLGGGGGTNFTPVFNYLDNQDIAPDLIIYFTDAKGIFPKQQPSYPIIWLVKGTTKIPWGARVQLN